MADISRRIMLGQEHLSSLRESHLQELAAQTRLDYVRVDSPSGFVEELHKEKYARRTPALSDLSWIPATLAFISLICAFILVPWRRSAV